MLTQWFKAIKLVSEVSVRSEFLIYKFVPGYCYKALKPLDQHDNKAKFCNFLNTLLQKYVSL